MFYSKNKTKQNMFLQLWRKHIHTHLLHAINTRVWQTDRRTHRQTHDDGIYRASIASSGKKSTQPFVYNGVVASQVSLKSACFRSAVDPTEVQW